MKGIHIVIILLFIGLFYSIVQMRSDSFEAETIQYVEKKYNATEVQYKSYKDFYNDSIWLIDCRMPDGYIFGSTTSHPTKIEAFMDMVLSIEKLKSKNRKITDKGETNILNFTEKQIDSIHKDLQ